MPRRRVSIIRVTSSRPRLSVHETLHSMHQRALYIPSSILTSASTSRTFVRCRLFYSIPVLLSRQPKSSTTHTRPTPHLSSQTLLRAVSSSSSFSSGSASLSTVTAVASETRNGRDKNAYAGANASSSSVIYVGPLTQTFRRLKIFSLSSLVLASSLSPFIFIVESSLPSTARAALATTALATSGVSTALVAWCGRPYVTTLRNLATTTTATATATTTTTSSPSPTPTSPHKPEPQQQQQGQEQTTTHSHNENVPAGIELTTLTLTLSPLTTRVYDPAFLCDTTRSFARWELARSVQLPPEDAVGVRPGSEETVAETLNGAGSVLGRWIVTWGENGEGSCRAEGRVET